MDDDALRSNTIASIKKINDISEGLSVNLDGIVQAVLNIGEPLNMIEMLKLSGDQENWNAQTSYLSIISECVRVFEGLMDELCELRKAFCEDAVYYYLEFLLACNRKIPECCLLGLNVSENSLAYLLLVKLSKY